MEDRGVEEFEPDIFFNKPYSVRQFVQFVSTSEVEDESSQETAKDDAANEESMLERQAEILNAIAGVVAPEPVIINLARAVVEQIAKAREHGIDVIPVPQAAANEFRLPPGHPREDVLYTAHPSETHSYLPTADFHRLAFEHKFAEAIGLLSHLGAETINVSHQRGWGRGFSGELGVGIPQAGAEAKVEGGEEASTEDQGLYYAELEGHNDPEVPEDLVWYPHEPTWKRIAEDRIKFGLQQFSLKLQYTDDYGVNADLAVDAQNAGFSLGGSFEKHQTTVWLIEGTFG